MPPDDTSAIPDIPPARDMDMPEASAGGLARAVNM
jgi:hypothetical protein